MKKTRKPRRAALAGVNHAQRLRRELDVGELESIYGGARLNDDGTKDVPSI